MKAVRLKSSGQYSLQCPCNAGLMSHRVTSFVCVLTSMSLLFLSLYAGLMSQNDIALNSNDETDVQCTMESCECRCKTQRCDTLVICWPVLNKKTFLLKTFNSLPQHVMSAPSLPVFHSRLKTHFFRCCFP